MKCIRCGRPLAAIPAATVQTKQGVSAWGPVCARKAGLLAKPERPKAAPLFRRHEPGAIDHNQIPLEFA